MNLHYIMARTRAGPPTRRAQFDISWLSLLFSAIGFFAATPKSFAQIPPTIVVHPQNANACIGGEATFYVEATGDQPLTLAWFRFGLPVTDGVVVSTPTNSYLTITNAVPPDASYHVTVTNPFGSTNSNPVILSVYSPPHIFQHPTNQNVLPGNTIVFNAMAGGQPPLDYRWWFQGRPLTNDLRISGADTDTLTITNAQIGDAGYYYFEVTNGCLVLDSEAARCDIGPAPPNITTQLLSQVVPFRTNVRFAIGAAGPPPIFYQWYRNDSPIGGAIQSSLNLAAVERPSVGLYHVVVRNAHGATASDRVHLQIELTLEGSVLYREEATDYLLSLTNAIRMTFAPPPTVMFRGAPLLFTTYGAAMSEPWEYRCNMPPNHSMWVGYASYRAEPNLRVSTEGSDFDTVLAVYQSAGSNNPTLITCDDNSGSDRRTSVVTFSAQAPMDYYIAVDGAHGERGTVRLQIGEMIRNARFNPANGRFSLEMAGPRWHTTRLVSSGTLFAPPQIWQTNLTYVASNRDWVVGYTNSNIQTNALRYYRNSVITNLAQ
jgi:hypothetical protein